MRTREQWLQHQQQYEAMLEKLEEHAAFIAPDTLEDLRERAAWEVQRAKNKLMEK